MRVILFDQGVKDVCLLTCGRPGLCYAVEKVYAFSSAGHGPVSDLGAVVTYSRKKMGCPSGKRNVEQGGRRVAKSESFMICSKQ